MEKISDNLPVKKDRQDIEEKPIREEDVVLVQPTKTMSTQEILDEMKKQGMRPLTLKEMLSLGKSKKIEPKDTDIVIEDTPEIKEGETKRLTE